MRTQFSVPRTLGRLLTVPWALLLVCLVGIAVVGRLSWSRVEEETRAKTAATELYVGSLAGLRTCIFQIATGTLSHLQEPSDERFAMIESRIEEGRALLATPLNSPDPEYHQPAQVLRAKFERFGEAATAIVQSDPTEDEVRATLPNKLREIERLGRELNDQITKELLANSRKIVGIASKTIDSSLAWVGWLLLFLGTAIVACTIGTFHLAERSVSGPVTHLVGVARAIMHGKARRRANPDLAGDFKELAAAFNRMLDASQQAEERLQIANESLELKVQARTIELWRANKALREESEQRAKAEREFHQAQKMDALGKLAGSIAHDFNNLLTVIIGGAECSMEQLGPDHPVTAMQRTIHQAGERAAGLTRPLLTFSRNQVLVHEVLSVNDGVQEVSRMLDRLIGVNIETKIALDPELHRVKANANQLQQVLVNLAVNARDAMEGVGVLTITTRNAQISAEVTERHGVPYAEHWIEVAVTDTGCGMDAATKARIFEPFFTTKPAGRGTGLGLSTVFGIVKQCGGILDVESEVGKGTTFRVFLPAVTGEAVVSTTPDTQMLKSVTTGNETLLLVDDEEDIREFATLTLESRGYKVLAAGSAEEAIMLAEKHCGEIRALLTDVIMPGINGVDLAEIVTRLVPDVRVLFVSGHSNESISNDTLVTKRARYLQKPYRGEVLAATVREVLEGADPSQQVNSISERAA